MMRGVIQDKVDKAVAHLRHDVTMQRDKLISMDGQQNTVALRTERRVIKTERKAQRAASLQVERQLKEMQTAQIYLNRGFWDATYHNLHPAAWALWIFPIGAGTTIGVNWALFGDNFDQKPEGLITTYVPEPLIALFGLSVWLSLPIADAVHAVSKAWSARRILLRIAAPVS
jgi:hypothetical protein